MEEKRGTPRIEFSGEDAIYGVLEKPDSTSEISTLPISDISEKGGRFILDLSSDREFNVGQKLLLKAIIGTRNIKFDEPMEFVVKWQIREDSSYFFGCELTSASKASQSKLIQLIQSEKSFDGKYLQEKDDGPDRKKVKPSSERTMSTPVGDRARKGGSASEISSPVPSIKDQSDEETEFAIYPEDGKRSPRSRTGVILGLVGCILLVLSFGYTYRTQNFLSSELNRLSGRIDRMEQKTQNIAQPPSSVPELKNIKDSIQALDGKAASLLQSIRKNEADMEMLSRRIDLQTQNISKIQEQMGELEKPLERPIETKAKVSAPPESGSQKEDVIHVVKPGENLFRISLKYNIQLKRLANYNNMNVNDTIAVGQKIRIPR